jgi:Dual specificity phosphatase, catalytic domain
MNTEYDSILEIQNPYDRVHGNLYIGGILSDYNEFDYVICCTPDATHDNRTNRVTHLVPFNDSRELPSENFITDVVALIIHCTGRGRTLVHCSAGLNRSGMMVALAMIREGWIPSVAVEYLRRIRSCSVLHNEVFLDRVLLGNQT